MDLGPFNSSVEAQMALEAMMMQMEKFPDFPSEAPPPASMMEFPVGVPLPPFVNTPPATSLTSITPSSGVTLNRTVVADPASASPIHANSTAALSKGAADDRRLRHRQTPMEVMREMVFRIAVMQPIHIDPDSVKPPKRRNVRISKDPQSVAARHRRERISERIRILQRLVPGGTKMDTASMLDEAIHYVKFLKTQVQSLEMVAASSRNTGLGVGFGLSPTAAVPGEGFSCSMGRVCVPLQQQFMNHTWTMSWD